MNVVGRSFGSDTVAIKNELGDWEVTVNMTEKRLQEGMEWEERLISTKCTDSSFEKAYGVAMNATLDKFNDAVTKTGSDSLFALEAPEVDKVQ